MRLDCDAALVDALRRPSVFLPVLDGSGRVVAVADYDQHVDCRMEATRPLVGIFSSLCERMRNKLVDAGMTLRSPNVRHLCTYCGAANSRTGVIVCTSLVLVALVLFPLSLRMNRKLQTQAHPPVSVGEIRAAGGLFIAAAGVLAFFGQGWALYGLVPVYWVSIVAGLIGSAMIVAPRNRLVQESAHGSLLIFDATGGQGLHWERHSVVCNRSAPAHAGPPCLLSQRNERRSAPAGSRRLLSQRNGNASAHHLRPGKAPRNDDMYICSAR